MENNQNNVVEYVESVFVKLQDFGDVDLRS